MIVPTGGTPIPPGSGIVPANTVTVITNYILTPPTNIGNITLDNTTGRFTIPVAGCYFLSGTLCFTINIMPTMFIYRVNVTTNIIEFLACSNNTNNVFLNPNTNTSANTAFLTLTPLTGAGTIGQTCATVATNACLNAGDQIFFAVIQSSGTISTSTASNRFIINKLCKTC